ncbi:MAG: hypothetical protein ACOC3C_00580 [Candidatus Thorarchaeota archaeon]
MSDASSRARSKAGNQVDFNDLSKLRKETILQVLMQGNFVFDLAVE